jgi:D-alanyl-D-alanine carboxypeptidase
MNNRLKTILTAGLAGAGLLAVAVIVLGILNTVPLSSEQARKFIEKEVGRLARKDPRLAGLTLQVSAPDRGFEESFGAENRTFHMASIGKLFTSVLVVRLMEQGIISADTPVASLIDVEILENLFVVGGIDYSAEVTIEQLLCHTSGVADYFDGKTEDGTPTVASLIGEETDSLWTPDLLLCHTRRHQKAMARPGEEFHYSDTGYVLLGLVLEKLHGEPYEQIVRRQIFTPLGMNDTYMPTRSLPVNLPAGELPPTWLNGRDLSRARSVSADWAGGGFASTSEDMVLFGRALLEGRLVTRESLDWMAEDLNLFGTGMHYGRGMMRLNFGEFFPLLAAYPRMIGHMGILGTQFFMDRESGTIVVISLCSTGFMPESVKLLISTTGICRRISR